MYRTAIKGTTIWATLEIRLIPPMRTRATQRSEDREAMTTDQEYEPIPGMVTDQEEFGSKKSLHGRRNPIDLGKGSDAEQTHTDAKKGKQFGQPFKTGPHAPLDIVKRSAKDMGIVDPRCGI